MRIFFASVYILLMFSLGPMLAVAQDAAPVSKSSTLENVMKGQTSPKTKTRQSDQLDGLSLEQKARFELVHKSLGEMVKARTGGVAGGGGNEKEADFVALARIIHQHLAQKEIRFSEMMGFGLGEYREAIESTEVHCAADPSLIGLMRELKKAAYFTTQPFRINLDCDRYETLKKSGDLGPLTVFHEYMRVIGKDTSAYEASSKLLLIFSDTDLVKSELAVDSGISDCWRRFEKSPIKTIDSLRFPIDIELELGRRVTQCLVEKGFTKKANPQLDSGDIIKRVGRLAFERLPEFNSGVNSLLKRYPPAR